jgi:hypothetical protein
MINLVTNKRQNSKKSSRLKKQLLLSSIFFFFFFFFFFFTRPSPKHLLHERRVLHVWLGEEGQDGHKAVAAANTLAHAVETLVALKEKLKMYYLQLTKFELLPNCFIFLVLLQFKKNLVFVRVFFKAHCSVLILIHCMQFNSDFMADFMILRQVFDLAFLVPSLF